MDTDELLKETAELRAKMYKIWKLIDAKKISNAEAHLHVKYCRAILETRRLDIAALYLAQMVDIPSALHGPRPRLPRTQ